MSRGPLRDVVPRHIIGPSSGQGDVRTIEDLLDTMHVPPPVVTEAYADKCLRAAAHLRRPSPEGPRDALQTTRAALPHGLVTPWASVSSPVSVGAPVALRNRAFGARARVFDVIREVAHLPPAPGRTSPFPALARLNARRRGFERVPLSDARASELARDLRACLDALDVARGSDPPAPEAQLSSARLSLDGMGGSGSPAVDLLGLTPDVDAVRAAKAGQAAALLDFTLRVPRVIFTADYSPDGESLGALLGWRRMPDASGYVVTRRNVFDGTQVVYTLDNARLSADHAGLREYVRTWVTSFYDGLDVDSLWLFADARVEPHAYYRYTLEAYQSRRDLRGSVFAVPTVVATSSPAQRAELKARMDALDPGLSRDRVSPWPLLAQYLLGDSRYDWVLAGVNAHASVVRRDPRSRTRSYDYLTAQVDFILEEMRAGRFVVPRDVGDVVRGVAEAVSSYGVSQVVEELLRETGVLRQLGDADSDTGGLFDRVVHGPDLAALSREGVLSTVLAAADPETATVDLRSLATNLPALLRRSTVPSSRSAPASALTHEVDVPDPDVQDSAVQSFDGAGLLDGDAADLTTYDGLSTFMRAIRTLSDQAAAVPLDVTVSDHRRKG